MRAPHHTAARATARAARAAALLALGACAPAAPGAADDLRLRPVRSQGMSVSSRVLQGQPLTVDPSRSLLDVLAAYWPATVRGDPRAAPLAGDRGLGVYVGNNYVGGWDFLRTVRAGEVLRVERLSVSEEYHRFGRGSANGAVVLTFNPIAR
jgi:hypothetical protein